jgi:hypothetical protein
VGNLLPRQGSLKQHLNLVIKILLYALKGTRKDVGSVAGLEMQNQKLIRDSDSVNPGSNPGPPATNRPDIVSYFWFRRSLE